MGACQYIENFFDLEGGNDLLSATESSKRRGPEVTHNFTQNAKNEKQKKKERTRHPETSLPKKYTFGAYTETQLLYGISSAKQEM